MTRRVAPLVVAAITALCAPSIAAACPCSQVPKPPSTKRENYDRAKGLAISESAQFKQEFAKAVEGAKAACQKHVGEPNVAVVSDIDETLLDNRPEFEDHTQFKWSNLNDWINSGQAKPLKPTADFLAWARQNGFAIFLVTGRTESQRRPTIENLVKTGIAYDGLYMRPDGNYDLAENVKTELRKNIEALGFKIIANIGDQYSDLYGGHAEDCEKLPNPFYYIP